MDAGQTDPNLVRLFSESNSRFVCEVSNDNLDSFKGLFAENELTVLGTVNDSEHLKISADGNEIVNSTVAELKQAWQSPLAW